MFRCAADVVAGRIDGRSGPVARQSRFSRRGTTLAAALAAAVALAGCGAYDNAPTPSPQPATVQAVPEPEPDPEPEPEPEPVVVAHAPLTGAPIFDEEAAARIAERPAVVVKIPNDPSARPQTGLEAADVVYEQETEAGVIRFAAVFHSRWPDVVGNVRSARAVDVSIVAPYRGIMVYSGARASNRELIAAAGLTTVTEGGAGFYRDGGRRAPHNLYVRLPQAASARSAEPVRGPQWRFAEEHPQAGRSLAGAVSVPMSRTATTSWSYDAEAGVFRRAQNGEPHRVTGQDAIGAANVVVLDVPVHGRDDHGAPLYAFEGRGTALLLRDGQAFDIGWAKDGVHGPLQLTDGAHEALLAPGPTWVMLTYDGALSRVGGPG
jgi:hypothetical protein